MVVSVLATKSTCGPLVQVLPLSSLMVIARVDVYALVKARMRQLFASEGFARLTMKSLPGSPSRFVYMERFCTSVGRGGVTDWVVVALAVLEYAESPEAFVARTR